MPQDNMEMFSLDITMLRLRRDLGVQQVAVL